MRDPQRIKTFCDKLASCWKKVPDWRFGQLMCNFLGWATGETGHDVFFIEEDDMTALLDIYFAHDPDNPQTPT